MLTPVYMIIGNSRSDIASETIFFITCTFVFILNEINKTKYQVKIWKYKHIRILKQGNWKTFAFGLGIFYGTESKNTLWNLGKECLHCSYRIINVAKCSQFWIEMQRFKMVKKHRYRKCLLWWTGTLTGGEQATISGYSGVVNSLQAELQVKFR